MAIQSNFPSLKPSLLLDFANTKQLDPRITFTRASTATYYDGKTTAMAEQNLLLQSEDFTNATYWATNGASVSFTANTSAAPNGATTADTMTAAAGTGNRYGSGTAFYPITSGLVYTASLFVKAGTDTVVQLILPTAQFGSTAFANFDVSGGVLGTVGATATAAISNAGNGWYRCSVTATATGSSTASIGFGFVFVANNTSAARLPSITAAGTETLLIWGAQLEQRSAVSAYTATTTAPITNYIPVLQTAASGVARFEHNPVTGESLGLEIEEQRTNLLTYSEQFDNAAWTKQQSSVTANTVIAPDGALTGDVVIQDTATNAHGLTGTIAVTSGTTYTWSVFAKAQAATVLQLTFGNASSTFSGLGFANFDLSAGTVSATGGTLVGSGIQAVGNGWYRCFITATATATATSNNWIAIANSTTSARLASYTGNGYSGIYIWGAQLEAGAFATSYIPTVASQVTRSADSASMTGTNFSSWYAADQGTLFFNGSTYNTSSPTMLTVSNGTATGEILQLNQTSGGAVRFEVRSGSTLQASITTSVTAVANTAFFTAATYKVNDFAAASNGGTVGTDTSGTTPVPDSLRLMQSGSGGTIFNGTIRKIAYYPLRVTNAQLQSLTTV